MNAPRLPRKHFYPAKFSVSENVGAAIGIAVLLAIVIWTVRQHG
jgi:hypothetical protein